jgi:hypothetical protein
MGPIETLIQQGQFGITPHDNGTEDLRHELSIHCTSGLMRSCPAWSQAEQAKRKEKVCRRVLIRANCCALDEGRTNAFARFSR